METDLELLALAARASGVEIKCVLGGTLWTPDGIMWDPLTNDADAFRLAVALDMRVSIGSAGAMAYWDSDQNQGSFTGPIEYYFDGRQSKVAATRRAVVRAAAEIELAKPPAAPTCPDSSQQG